MTQIVDNQSFNDFKSCTYSNFSLYLQQLKIVLIIQLIGNMRQLGKTYITLFGNTIEIDSNTIIENKISVKTKEVTKVKKELIVPTVFNINYSKNPGKERELTSEDSDAISKFISDSKIKRESYYCTNDNLYLLVEDMSITQVRIILYIAAKLKYNSNVFVADYAEISKELNVSTNTIQRSFISMCESYNQIIIKTNRPKTYLINHNVIF